MQSRDAAAPATDPMPRTAENEPSAQGPWGAVVRSERMAEAEARIAASGSSPAAVAEFWESVEATPLWEPDKEIAGAWRVTFLWRGEPELTRHVTLCGPVVFAESMATGGCPLEQIPGTDIWHLTLRVPPQTRSTYVISPTGFRRAPEDLGEFARVVATWVKDPLNPGMFVVPANALVPEFTQVYSLLEAPDAPAQRWRIPQPGVAKGELEEHVFASSVLQNTRRVWTYTPVGWSPDEREYPLLLAFDGWQTVTTTGLPVVLDNLIAAGAIPPVVAVMIDCGTLEMRGRELDCHEPFLAFLTDEILPWATDRWGLAVDRSRTLVAGMSLGGRAAVFAGLRRPDVFGNVIAQSTAVTESGPRTIDALAHHAPTRRSEKLAFYFDVGLLEIDNRGDKAFLQGTRRLREVLQASGHDVHYAELACGHDEIVVGESIADGLQLLLTASETPEAR